MLSPKRYFCFGNVRMDDIKATSLQRFIGQEQRIFQIGNKRKEDGNFLLYDKDDKVNPPEPLRRGTKVEGKWQNGLRAPKLGPNQDKWEKSFNDGPDIIFTKLDSHP